MAEGSSGFTSIVAGLAALLGVFATWQSTTNSGKIEANRISLERDQQTAEYRLAVFERVADAIENAEANPQQIRAAVLLVNTLPDDSSATTESLKQQLLVILVEGGVAAGGEAAEAVDAIRNQTSDVPEAAITKQMQAPALVAVQAPTVQAPSATAPVTRSLALPGRTPPLRDTSARLGYARAAGAWNVDVFYCDGSGAAQNQVHATAFNQALTAEVQRQSASESASGGMATRLGQVRLRPLTEDAYKRLGYDGPSDFVRAEASEAQAAANLAAFAQQARGASPMTVVSSRQPTPYYLAAYYCGARS